MVTLGYDMEKNAKRVKKQLNFIKFNNTKKNFYIFDFFIKHILLKLSKNT